MYSREFTSSHLPVRLPYLFSSRSLTAGSCSSVLFSRTQLYHSNRSPGQDRSTWGSRRAALEPAVLAESLLLQQDCLMNRLEGQTPLKLSEDSDKPLMVHQGISTYMFLWIVCLSQHLLSLFSDPVTCAPSILRQTCLSAPLKAHSCLSQVPMISPSSGPEEPQPA